MHLVSLFAREMSAHVKKDLISSRYRCVQVFFSSQHHVFSPQITFQLQPARVYLEDTFVYYIKTLFHTYIPDSAMASATAGTQKRSRGSGSDSILPAQVCYIT